MNNINLILYKASQFEFYSKKQAGILYFPTYEYEQYSGKKEKGNVQSLKKSLIDLYESIQDPKLKDWYNYNYLICVRDNAHLNDFIDKMGRVRKFAPREVKQSPEFESLMTKSTQLLINYETGGLPPDTSTVNLRLDPSRVKELEDMRRRMELHNAIADLEKEFPSETEDPKLEQLTRQQLIEADPLSWAEGRKKDLNNPYKRIPIKSRIPDFRNI